MAERQIRRFDKMDDSARLPDFREEAERYANRGLDADNVPEELRDRCIAYAQVLATLEVGKQLANIAAQLRRGVQVDTGGSHA